MKKLKNTYRKGILTFLAYKTKENTYVAACEELCILAEDKDAELAKLRTLAQTQLYLETVIEDKLGEHLLNQSLPNEIKEEFYEAVNSKAEYFEKKPLTLKKVLESDFSDKNVCFC
jgi:hypothetical protein